MTAPIPAPPLAPDPTAWPGDGLTMTWLGHASMLLRLHGTWILIDPVLEERIGIGRGRLKLGPRRLVQPALGVDAVPPPDLLLLSHAHMDHTDLGTLARLPRDTHAVVQTANGDLARRFRRVTELAWHQSVEVGGVRVTSVPALHWGARTVYDKHRGYGGYVIEKDGVGVLFAGDTAYTEIYREIGARHRIDVAIFPIGAYDPWIANHASPEQAWAIFRDTGARWVVPRHHLTFVLSREPLHEPLERFLAAA
ncbi:MAG TPA: MBL fold metallo-hydrolase, partial [Gemmatimonadales bacterium]|nr:MBL fold metallo-hydrolase [Gemmatimonadales bacterium]